MQDKPYSSKLNHQPFILRCKPLTVHAARRSIVLPKNEEYMKWSTKQSWQTGETKMKITAWEWVTLRRICSFSCKTPPFCSLDTISLSWKAGRHSSPLYLALSLLSLWVERVCYGQGGYLKALLHTWPPGMRVGWRLYMEGFYNLLRLNHDCIFFLWKKGRLHSK